MISMSIETIAQVLGGRLIGADALVDSVMTDSRQIEAGNDYSNYLFIALKGPHFDAHQFLSEFADRVGGMVVDHPCEVTCAQIVVENTHKALADLARYNRSQCHASVIAITGSSGKTTVKEMTAAILSNAGLTLATQGNFNNDIGAPLTLLNLNHQHQFAVIELGANHEGEIAFTSDLTQPDVAVVNNVAESHLEGFGDIQGVARAKSEIYFSLDKSGVAVVNQDDRFASFFEQRIESKMLRFSMRQESDVYASAIKVNSDQSTSFNLNYQQQTETINLAVIGRHNVANALAAASCCLAIGISLKTIAVGLQQAATVSGRLVVKQLQNGCQIIDDSYNANVASMTAAIHLLSQFQGKRILVIGDMAELGETARECHQQIGELAKEVGIDHMFSCGVLTQFAQRAFNLASQSTTASELNEINKYHFSEQSELITRLIKEAKNGVTILVKGSRSAHMENVVKALVDIDLSAESLTEDQQKDSDRIASLSGDQ